MPRISSDLGIGSLLWAYLPRIAATWLVVLIENVLIAFVPLLIGLSIDGLLAGKTDEFLALASVLIVLGFVAVGRRIYDTRVYGTIRVDLGSSLYTRRLGARRAALKVSKDSARLDMSRELVDFLEYEMPELMTAVIQIAVSLAILALFDVKLAVSSLLVVIGMIAVYACFHHRFYRFNAQLNAQRERQVDIVEARSGLGLFRHLRALRQSEVAISDTEAIVYGGIFLLQITFVCFNLYVGTHLPGVTAGAVFSIAAYSWEYVEAALLLPMALQSWSRLSEITARIRTA